MPISLFRRLAAAMFFCAVFLGCNDKYSPIGSDFLIDTVNIASASAATHPLILKAVPRVEPKPIFNSGSLYIGKANGTEAFSIVRFTNIPDTLGLIEAQDIISAKISLTPRRYIFGDSIANILSFRMLGMKRLWSPLATADSLTPDYFNPATLAEYSGQIPLSDTMPPIMLDFDKNLLVEWLKLRAQYRNDSLIYGVAFMPNDNSTVIRRFSTRIVGVESVPLVTIEAIYSKDNKVDTLRLESGYDGTFSRTTLQANESDVFSQNVVNIATDLQFDFTMLPKNIAIQQATLSLTLDRSRIHIGNNGLDSILYAETIDSSFNNLRRTYFALQTRGTDEYTFPVVVSFVDAAVRSKGFGTLKIRSNPSKEYSELNRMVFFGPNCPDSTKRPRFKVVYSTRPQR